MIYLDNSATTRPFDSVAQRMHDHMLTSYFNASAAYRPAMEVEREISACRKTIAQQLGAQAEEVYFTSGGTESDNLAILGVASLLRKPMNVLVSEIEHPAVSQTMQRLERMGHEIRVMPIDSRGVVDLEKAEQLMDENTALVSCMQVSNETGAVQPVARLSAMVKKKNKDARMHVDGVQGFMRVPLHMGREGIDLYALSGHKIHGPKGVGALVVRKGVRLAAQMTGGGQEKDLRSGTYNSSGIIGLGDAVAQMAARADDIEAMRSMKLRLWERLGALEGVKLNGPVPHERESAPHILSVSFDGVRGEVMRNALEGEGIYVSTGSACASHKQKVSRTLQAMGLNQSQADGTIRISLGLYNTMEEMDEAAAKMEKIFMLLRQYRRR